jgi:hypothetical protein
MSILNPMGDKVDTYLKIEEFKKNPAAQDVEEH